MAYRLGGIWALLLLLCGAVVSTLPQQSSLESSEFHAKVLSQRSNSPGAPSRRSDAERSRSGRRAIKTSRVHVDQCMMIRSRWNHFRLFRLERGTMLVRCSHLV
jgi:hypothetical protein